MKEQMFELLAQARDQPVDVVKRAPYGSCILTPAQLEQYTKLVVQKCAGVADEHEPLNTWTKRYSTLIKEHFGVRA
jgi:hypothetical protein